MSFPSRNILEFPPSYVWMHLSSFLNDFPHFCKKCPRALKSTCRGYRAPAGLKKSRNLGRKPGGATFVTLGSERPNHVISIVENLEVCPILLLDPFGVVCAKISSFLCLIFAKSWSESLWSERFWMQKSKIFKRHFLHQKSSESVPKVFLRSLEVSESVCVTFGVIFRMGLWGLKNASKILEGATTLILTRNTAWKKKKSMKIGAT